MTVAYEKYGVIVHHGDCLDVLPSLPDAWVDAVVCDPPYELAFMGRTWDSSGIAFNPAVWRECLRILKPGGHLLAFGGSRTWHRLACAIEDAGFELRDSIAWLYGSGFPKSLDVSKAIDKARDDREDINRVTGWLAEQRDRAGLTNRQIDAVFGFSGMAGHWTAAPHLKIAQVPRWDQWEKLRDLIGFGDEMDAEVRRLNGRKGTPGHERADRMVTDLGGNAIYQPTQRVVHAGTPVLTTAQQWAGWGTALKPAFEPIVVARRPLHGTVAANVVAYGTGALNIDGCRVATVESTRRKNTAEMGYHGGNLATSYETGSDAGRWPTNVVLDGDTADALDAESGEVAKFFPTFHYQAKAPTRERPTYTTPDGRKIAHPTVKPLALMRWLVRLVTPPAGVVLDPFVGSGSTLEAAVLEGFRAIGVEREESHLPLIGIRLDRATVDATSTTPDAPLVSETLSLLDLLDDGAA